MSRVKKTRSLKRIHGTKTGSIAKFKKAAREAGADRQGGKRVKGRKVLSVYEKYLLENPEAREKDAPKAGPEAKPAQKAKPEEDLKHKERKRDENKDGESKGSDLLDMLDNKNLDDYY